MFFVTFAATALLLQFRIPVAYHRRSFSSPLAMMQDFKCSSIVLNLQATKLFIVTSATKGGVITTPLRFRVRFKILYRVIHPLIQHCLLHEMVYLNIIYVIATRNYEFFTTVSSEMHKSLNVCTIVRSEYELTTSYTLTALTKVKVVTFAKNSIKIKVGKLLQNVISILIRAVETHFKKPRFFRFFRFFDFQVRFFTFSCQTL